MDHREWVRGYAEAIGAKAPDDAMIDAILRLAAEAAHSSERQAAPVACWLAASAGLDPAEALRVAETLGGATR